MHHVEFEPGLTLLRIPSPRSAVVHRLAVERLREVDGSAYWIDARNAAATHVLYDCAPSRRTLSGLRIARAFTAYQHHSLVREVTRAADGRTSLLVATNVASLYRDDDLPEWEREDLLAASLSTLGELGRALEVPVLATTTLSAEAEASAGLDLAARADREIECTRTRAGLRLEGDGAETAGYPGRGYWQTTIPYWVEICGAADAIAVDPVVVAHDRGLVDVGADGGGADRTVGEFVDAAAADADDAAVDDAGVSA